MHELISLRSIAAPSATSLPHTPFERLSLSRQFLIGSALLLALGAAIIGSWISREIEQNAVNRAAAIAAVYVESILAAQLGDATPEQMASREVHAALDRIFNEGPLGRKVVRFKLWDATGVIRYSSDHDQIGRRFPLDASLAAAFSGTVHSQMSDLNEAAHAAERSQWERLLEVHVPVRAGPHGRVVAVAEFYHSTDSIERDIQSAQQRSWALLAAVTLAIFFLLFLQVRRANETIRRQRNDLRVQLQQLQTAFAENERMRARLAEAGAATTALNERLLHRIAADLHDAPAQTLAFALMSLEEMAASCACQMPGDVLQPNLQTIVAALRSSLEDLRNIAAGLGIPGLAELSLSETVRRALRDAERLTGMPVTAQVEANLPDAPLAVKITVYRLLQESLHNCRKHAPNAHVAVHVGHVGEMLRIEVSDDGPGFDPQAVAGRLGLSFMQERVRLLGGQCEVIAAPGQGTRIAASLPLVRRKAAHA
ncbi:sensor histidine kinase [Sulfuricystis multivorans]|uniref:sensor histidine kinase n=1 Tax=Sulfuricystis multivorans TaxID=2211108 RepID=UPI000F82180F|nr:sensor histidine kinase [Sulfuricystis multivorans]